MKHTTSILLAVMVGSCASSVFAQDNQGSDLATRKYWNEQYKILCKYDSYCGGVTNGSDSDGLVSFKKPVPEVLKILSLYKKDIYAYAKRFDVDPRAIVGSILAENSLNSDMKDHAKNLLTRIGLAKNGYVLGHYRSIGFGLIHCDTAQEGEKHAAEVEHRRVTADGLQKVCSDLMSVVGSIYASAVIAKQAQDTYAKHGFHDVKKHPEILATLYNLGNYDNLAAKAQSEHRDPRMNWFGFFVKRFMPQISQAIGYDEWVADNTPAAPVAATTPATVAQPAENAAPAVPDVPVATTAIKLFNSTGACVQTSSVGSSGVIAKDERFEKIATGIDCDGNTLTLVRGEKGASGWVSKEKLTGSYTMKAPDPSCKVTSNPACASKVSTDLASRTRTKGPSARESYYGIFPTSNNTCGLPKRAAKKKKEAAALSAADVKAMKEAHEKYKAVYLAKYPNAAYPAYRSAGTAYTGPYGDFYDPNAVDSMLEFCRIGSCTGSKDDFLKAMKLTSFDQVSAEDLKIMESGMKMKVADAANVRKQLKGYVENCVKLAQSLPSDAYTQSLVQSLGIVTTDLDAGEIPGGAFDDVGALKDASDVCSTLRAAAPSPAPSASPGPGSANCATCATSGAPSVPTSQSSPTPLILQAWSTSSMKSQELYNFLFSGSSSASHSFSAVLNKAYQRVGSTGSLNGQQQPQMTEEEKKKAECEDDQQEAADTIDSLTENACVAQVYVSDLYMYDFLIGKDIPVVYRPFGNRHAEQFLVSLKTQTKCGGEPAEAEAKTPTRKSVSARPGAKKGK